MIEVLYADDEESLLALGKEYLEMSGEFRVETALSAKEALSKMVVRRFDVIVSDYQMPDMDGLEFLRTVRTGDRGLPFILFTGRGREEVVIEALNNGADAYMQKGNDFRSQFVELMQKLRQAVKKRKAEEEVLLAQLKANLAMDLVRIASWEFDTVTGLFKFDDLFYSLYGTDALQEGGYTATTGSYIQKFVHPVDKERVDDFMNGSGRRDDPSGLVQIEHRIIRRDGDVRWVKVRVGTLAGADGHPIRMYGVTYDITELKKAEEGIRRLNADIDRLSSAIERSGW